MASLESEEALQKAHADAVAAGDVELYKDAVKSLHNAANVATSAARTFGKDLEAVKDFNSIVDALKIVQDAAKSVEAAAADTIKAAVSAASGINDAAKIPAAAGRAAITSAKASRDRALDVRQP